MPTQISTVAEYLESLPEDRRAALNALREVILANLPEGYEEVFQYGMINYVVPLSRYPNTYNGLPLGYAAIASQKNYISVYLMGVYGDESHGEWFRQEFAKTGKRLDMGKSCVRFKKPEDIPLDLIGRAVALFPVDDFIALYERNRGKG
ncbi:uncharacterized protein YdhG (YjbR/CyaY superfamily) [Symbiobacterium terraclitae]|uniref:Uncharacterized protein YdhG (YjbR/CyaY superfamily) n=1 Tax=Symbiobacterium terraclitae TaxID=557451 RepID=A0ABS4JM67_9FIRM|nr:DUF1801 domain-containing protein [Symbiobacterium terraclitae]MBP2016631.1 uncharacterized protein YdhG (YjbR/CyaY superfamily) [Symbiobacterium terraclitae]